MIKRFSNAEVSVEMIMGLRLATIKCLSLPDHLQMVVQNNGSTDDIASVGTRPLIDRVLAAHCIIT